MAIRRSGEELMSIKDWDWKYQKALKQQVFIRDNWRCRNCNRSDMLDPHHVVYRSAGGVNEPYNLLTLCRSCHNSVHAGRLKVEILKVLDNNILVKFWVKSTL